MFRSIGMCAAASLLMSAATGVLAQQEPAKDKSARPAAATAPKAAPKPAAKTETVVGRDWTKIDTNKDHYISPEEMEVWLKANGPDSK